MALRDRAGLPSQARRVARIANGLADPASRGRYLQQAKRRLRRDGPPRDVERCLVCRAPEPEHQTIDSAKTPVKTRDVRICARCGHVSLPDNRNDYRERDYSQLPSGIRTGGNGRPGRDFHIARLGLQALGRGNADVLLYGVGASRDNHTIIDLPRVRSVAIGDIMRLRDDGEFVDLTQPPERRFDLVIASEVIEHFRDPIADFRTLFSFAKRRGVIVCGTNIYAGNDLSRDPYIFYSDHTSYYSARALAVIAEANGFHIDFRMPVTGRGLRKRYVFFTRSRAALDRLAVFFGTHTHAPSERRHQLTVKSSPRS